MTEKRTRFLHYIFSISVVLISAIFHVRAIYVHQSGELTECVMYFGVAYFLVFLVVVYLYLINHHVKKTGDTYIQDKVTYSRIAMSLASDYESVYYINTEDGSYIEYGMSDSKDEELSIISSGKNFYSDVQSSISKFVFEDDQQKSTDILSQSRLMDAFNKKETMVLSYRVMTDGKPVYYNLKVTHGRDEDEKYIIIGIKNVDAQVRQEEKNRQAVQEGETFGKIAQALASRYEVLYFVDIETNEYVEYSSSDEYSKLEIGDTGKDFFEDTQKNMKRDIFPDDYPMMAKTMEKEYFLEKLSTSGVISVNYRLVLNGKPVYMELRAVRPKNDNKHVVVGAINVNDAFIHEEELQKKLDNVIYMANRDALTGVKNKNSYAMTEADLNRQIEAGEKLKFAIIVCDVNNLKIVNDTYGHKAGDEYIRAACVIVCKIFKRSPVYRVGGDEFVALLKGDDYENRVYLFEELRTQVEINREEGRVVLACGLAEYNSTTDKTVASVFERADNQMYEHKKMLKESGESD